MSCVDMDAVPDAPSPITGGEGPALEADLFLFDTAAAMPPPNSAPAVNTAAWTITALGICLLGPKAVGKEFEIPTLHILLE